MKNKARLFLMVILVLAFCGPAFAQGFRGYDSVPAPEYLSPRGEQINATGKDSVEFKWRAPGMFGIDHCEFKLYKGNAASQGSLVFSQDVSPVESCVDVKTDLLQDGQDYTLLLRSIARDGTKSDKVFVYFSVIKK